MSQWALTQPSIKDQYFCMSRQSKTGKVRNGKVYSTRHALDAMFLKAVWLDIDVKEPPKGYTNVVEAITALKDFLKAENIEFPTAIVKSGGGVHVYWISANPLTRSEWLPYGEGMKQAALRYGLRCDAGISSDAARILRVPDTFNHKQEPKRPVKLIWLAPNDADFTKLPTAQPNVTVAVNMPDAFKGVTPSKLFAHLDPHKDILGDKTEHPPLDPRPIIKGCPFFRDAFTTHGKGHAQPLWNLTVLSTTFMEGGEKLAHAFSNGHPGYTQAETAAMFDRKMRERTEKGLGWPACASFEGEGAVQCRACPHRGKIKTPLHLALNQVVPAPLAPIPKQANLCLPENYSLDPDGIICEVVTQDMEDGSQPLKFYLPLFQSTCKLSDPWCGEPDSTLNFTVTKSKDDEGTVTLKLSDISTNLYDALTAQGVKYNPKYKTKLESFFMAWINELHKIQQANRSVPFGWLINPKGERSGFVYGGKQMFDDGKEQPAGYGSPVLRPQYTPVGDRAAWFKALDLVVGQKRPALEAIVCTAFASPLLFAAGINSGTFCAHGDTGTNKSTALTLAISVWGHPLLTKLRADSTRVGIDSRMAQIQCLPICIDEVRGRDDMEKIYKGPLYNTEGISRDRMNSDMTFQNKQMWQSLLVLCSNDSFAEYVSDKQKTHDAGAVRVFEFLVPSVSGKADGKIETVDAMRTLENLKYNFGLIGLEYAKYLALHHRAIDKFTTAEIKRFAIEVNQAEVGDKERFWIAMCGCILSGAQIANKVLNTKFDIEALRSFLQQAYFANRQRIKEESKTTTQNILSLFTGFLKDTFDRQIWTGTVPKGAGKPSATTIYAAPRKDYMRKGLSVHWCVDDGFVRVSRKDLQDYLQKADIQTTSVVNGIKKHFGARVKYVTLGVGTGFDVGQEGVLEIDVKPGSLLVPMMYARVPENKIPEEVKSQIAEQVNTQGGYDLPHIGDEAATVLGDKVAAAIAVNKEDVKTVEAGT
jgi:hypothetical protein